MLTGTPTYFSVVKSGITLRCIMIHYLCGLQRILIDLPDFGPTFQFLFASFALNKPRMKMT